MAIPFDKILVRHWVRLLAKLTNKYCGTVSIIKKDLRIYYVKLKDCIHVNALLSNDYDIYNEYVTITEQKEHSVTKFKNLLSEWDPTKLEPLDIGFDGDDFYVRNGVHRLSILFLLNGPDAMLPLNLVTVTYPKSIVDEVGVALKLTTTTAHYNGWANGRKEYGYHSFNIGNVRFIGQRDPLQRLNKMRQMYNFTDKYVVDIGSNTGGMLFHLFEIKKGLGVDFDTTCIDASTLIKNKLRAFDHLEFVQRDIQKEEIKDLFVLKPDVVFLLSMGSWLKNWREVYTTVLENTDTIFLETNNDSEGLPQLNFFKECNSNIDMVSEKSDDDCTNNFGRKTYMITKKRT